MDVFPSFVNMLLQAHCRVSAIVEVLLIYLASIVLINVPTMKHYRSSCPLVLRNSGKYIDVKPSEQDFCDVGKIVKSLLQ